MACDKHPDVLRGEGLSEAIDGSRLEAAAVGCRTIVVCERFQPVDQLVHAVAVRAASSGVRHQSIVHDVQSLEIGSVRQVRFVRHRVHDNGDRIGRVGGPRSRVRGPRGRVGVPRSRVGVPRSRVGGRATRYGGERSRGADSFVERAMTRDRDVIAERPPICRVSLLDVDSDEVDVRGEPLGQLTEQAELRHERRSRGAAEVDHQWALRVAHKVEQAARGAIEASQRHVDRWLPLANDAEQVEVDEAVEGARSL